jgi:hypothetical protein
MGNWRVLGIDGFDDDAGFYLVAKCDTEQEAFERAQSYLQELERTQPISSSGGQGPDGIQDQVYIQRPEDGAIKRIYPLDYDPGTNPTWLHPTKE